MRHFFYYHLHKKNQNLNILLTIIGTITNTAAHYLQYELPDEVLLTIFTYLTEKDLCRVSQVCKRFQMIANDTELWKNLYQQVYEYDLPLFNPALCKFEFVSPEESEYSNPWKESFRQLYRGVHVRPGFPELKYKGSRHTPSFSTIQAALDYIDEFRSNNGNGQTAQNPGTTTSTTTATTATATTTSSTTSASQANNCCGLNGDEAQQHLIFLHTGTYRGEFLVIDSDIALIGAAPGNVAESVILERESESTVMFVEGAKRAYAGHLTLKFTPDVTSNVPHHKHYCLEVGENCSPTIDHCIIRSSSVGE